MFHPMTWANSVPEAGTAPPASWGAGTRLFVATAATIFLLLFLRRPDALTAPQFFAEDGMIFFHDQLLFGIRQALGIPHAGYVLAVQRLTALLGSYFCPAQAPAVYDITALTLSACCCAFFVLPVFRVVVRSDLLRFVVCCLFAIALDSAELIGTITQIQWFLQLAGILLLVRCWIGEGEPHVFWRILEGLLVLLLALSCPLLVLAVPLALWLLLRRKGMVQSLALLAGVAVQMAIYVQAGESRGQSSVFGAGGPAGAVAAAAAQRNGAEPGAASGCSRSDGDIRSSRRIPGAELRFSDAWPGPLALRLPGCASGIEFAGGAAVGDEAVRGEYRPVCRAGGDSRSDRIGLALAQSRLERKGQDVRLFISGSGVGSAGARRAADSADGRDDHIRRGTLFLSGSL